MPQSCRIYSKAYLTMMRTQIAQLPTGLFLKICYWYLNIGYYVGKLYDVHIEVL